MCMRVSVCALHGCICTLCLHASDASKILYSMLYRIAMPVSIHAAFIHGDSVGMFTQVVFEQAAVPTVT